MKKVSILFVGLFLICITNANAIDKNCFKYGVKAMNAEHQAYGFTSEEEIDESYQFFYDLCVAAGGNISDPVFI